MAHRGISEAGLDSHSGEGWDCLERKDRIRDQLSRDVDSFLKSGGKITVYPYMYQSSDVVCPHQAASMINRRILGRYQAKINRSGSGYNTTLDKNQVSKMTGQSISTVLAWAKGHHNSSGPSPALCGRNAVWNVRTVVNWCEQQIAEAEKELKS